MQLNSTFKVPVPVDEAWRVMLDYPRLARCMPGATVTDVQRDEELGDYILGQVKVKLGPVSVTYQGKVTFTEKDESRHRVALSAAGREVRGSGTASARVTAVMTDVGGVTQVGGVAQVGGVTEVSVSTDLDITGRPAQFGRGVVAEVSERLIGQFAENLARELESSQTVAAAPPTTAPPTAAPTVTASTAPAASGSADSLDLLGLAGGPVLKRLAPALAVLAAVAGAVAGGVLVRRARKGRS